MFFRWWAARLLQNKVFSLQSKQAKLVGGFNPSEKYESNWKSSPNRGENKKYLKPPPSKGLGWVPGNFFVETFPFIAQKWKPSTIYNQPNLAKPDFDMS